MNARREFLKKSLLAGGTLAVSNVVVAKNTIMGISSQYNLPYKNTYVKEPLVTDNEYLRKDPVKTPIPSFETARKILPEPIWENHKEEVDMYWRAWQIAVKNICHPKSESGFVTTYIDTAYNGNIFMWDSAFITMFARYGNRVFPFQQTLDNFYSHQHPDGFICREIKADGADCFERYDPTSTGPNLLPWSEIMYFQLTGDTDRLHKVFPVLSSYYRWLNLNRTWPNGTYWSSGWGTGMDNMPRVQSKYNPIYSHGHMIWLDTNLQQIFTAALLLQIGFYTERWQEIEEFEEEAKCLSAYVSNNLWDDEKGFLFDQYADGSLCSTMGIGAFWALHTDILSKERLDKLVGHLNDIQTFKRAHRVPSLAANHPKYNVNGRYWQGGVWAPTNYMIINGLRKKGYENLSYEIAMNHYTQILNIFKRTGTFYEYYSPEYAEPGFMARQEFVGWTGLPPISILFEYILGIEADYPNGKIHWFLRQTDRHGILRYPYGQKGSINLICSERKNPQENPILHIETNEPFILVLHYDNKIETFDIQIGKQRIG